MPTKSYHGVTLWAVPRFHRADILPAKPGMNSAGMNGESGADWMSRLKTYSFPLGETGESAGHILDQAELRH